MLGSKGLRPATTSKGRPSADSKVSMPLGRSIHQKEKPADFFKFLEFYHLAHASITDKYVKNPGDAMFIAVDERFEGKGINNWKIVALYCKKLNEEPKMTYSPLNFNEKTGIIKQRLCTGEWIALFSVVDWLPAVLNQTPRPIINGLYKLPNLSWTTLKKVGEVLAAHISLVEFETGQVPGSFKQGFMKKINVKMHTRIHVNLMNKALTMFKCRHSQHFVQLLGVNYDSGTAIFMETCMTSLYCFLTANQGKTGQVIKLKWSNQAAEALVYLKKVKIVHRALRTKVCFLTNDLNLKIGGFDHAGLGESEGGCYGQGYRFHETYLYDYPASVIRWLPPETLGLNQFGHQSEVWSYGVLIWEIYYDGLNPYEGMTDYVIKKNLKWAYEHNHKKNDGRRAEFHLRLPKTCPRKVRSLMHSCFHCCAPSRPQIEVISEKLNRFYEAWAVPSNMKSRLINPVDK